MTFLRQPRPEPGAMSSSDQEEQDDQTVANRSHSSSMTHSQDLTSESAIENSRPLKFVKKVFANVTIEPMLFLKMVAESNLKITADTLEIDRICRVNLNYTERECEMMDNGDHSEIQNAVQTYQVIFNYHQNLMDSTIPLFMLIFIGFLGERYGRKWAMIIVLAGFIAFGLVYIATALNESWPVQVLYLATLLVDMSGSWVVFNMTVYSYLAHITSVESRTKRMGFADAVWYLGSPIGILLGGLIYKVAGYVAVYAVSCSLWLICLLYTLFFINENRSRDVEDVPFSPVGFVVSLFKTVFKRRPEKGHFHIIILVCLKLGVFLVQGHNMYVWARKVLQWGPTAFSLWSSLDGGFHQFGLVIWVWIAERLNLHNCTVANGGLFSILLWSVTLASITGPSLWWLTIVASLLGSFEASIEPAIRSMLTAIVGLGEEGKILAVLGILESAWLSVDRAIYTYLYNAYIEVFPQISFVVQTGFAVLLIIVIFLLKGSLLKNTQAGQEAPSAIKYQHTHEL